MAEPASFIRLTSRWISLTVAGSVPRNARTWTRPFASMKRPRLCATERSFCTYRTDSPQRSAINSYTAIFVAGSAVRSFRIVA